MLATVVLLAGCASGHKYHDKAMDFGAVKTVAILPFNNLTPSQQAGERVRDVFGGLLLASGAVYVLPFGDVARAVQKGGVVQAAMPTKDEAIALGKALAADAVITGTVKEYGEVRSGPASANSLSVSLSMFETSSGKVVWSAATTKGGVGFTERLFGGGGQSMNVVTEEAARELLGKLFNQ